MDRIYNLLLVFVLIFTATLSIPYGIKVGKKYDYIKHIEHTVGTVIGFDGKLLAIEFDHKVIQGCGDTEIHSFLVSQDGKAIQLKPIFLPEKKANELSSNTTFVFPVSDILPLLEPQVYAIQIFIKSDCSILTSKSIELPLISLDLRHQESITKENI